MVSFIASHITTFYPSLYIPSIDFFASPASCILITLDAAIEVSVFRDPTSHIDLALAPTWQDGRTCMLLYTSNMIHLVQSRVGDDNGVAMDARNSTVLCSGYTSPRRNTLEYSANKTTATSQTTMSRNTNEDDANMKTIRQDSNVDNGEMRIHTMRTGAIKKNQSWKDRITNTVERTLALGLDRDGLSATSGERALRRDKGLESGVRHDINVANRKHSPSS